MRLPQSVFITGNMPFAQSELSRCLTAMTGAELRPEGYPFTVTAGQGRGEGYRVSVTGRHTDIQGESPRAAVYGVYALLERLGAQFLAEDCEILPSVTEWKPMSFSSRPDFAYRDLYWRGALNGRRFRRKWAAKSASIATPIPLRSWFPRKSGSTLTRNISRW